MDWFRRNWPDLLIGIALVAVIAGIIATLITGGSFFPVGQTARTGTAPAQSSTTAPGATTPDTGSTPAASADASGPASTTTTPPTAPSADASAGGSSTAPAAGATTPSTGAAASDATPGAAAGGSGSGIAVLPPSDDGAPASAAGASTPTPSTSTTTPTTPTPTTTAPATGAASSSGSVSGSAASAPAGASTGPGSDAPFRISVGAFGQAENAQRQAATFRDAGFPVFTADQGNLTIVLVGPYASQSEAETVAARIRAGGFGVDPVIYRFRGEADSAPAPAATAPSNGASTADASTGAAAPSGAPAATSGEGRYLQAGAYGNADSAQPQKQRLESLGFTVTERTEGGLIKLLIGPFDAERLQQAQSDLNAAGIESFPR